jgi:molybdopterin/thiamine biosynthesis adenylyltransferase
MAENCMHMEQQFRTAAFSRNIGLLTEEEQERLKQVTVAIPGLGGVGGSHLICLARAGIGRFHLADFDTFDMVNVNRQYGARIPDMGRPKLDVLAEEALEVNPYVELKKFPEGVTRENLASFLKGVQVVVDGLDFFAVDERRMLFMEAHRLGIFVITAGPMGFSSSLLVFDPDRSPDFDTYFDIRTEMTKKQRLAAFAVGLSPRPTHLSYIDMSKVDLEAEIGPSLGSACYLCTAMAVTETLRIVLGRPGLQPVPHYCQFDPNMHTFRQGCLRWGNRGPLQRIKMWWVLRRLQ